MTFIIAKQMLNLFCYTILLCVFRYFYISQTKITNYLKTTNTTMTTTLLMFIVAFALGALFSYVVLALLVFKRKNDDIELEIQNFRLLEELKRLRKA